MITVTRSTDTTSICRKRGSIENQPLWDALTALKGKGFLKTPAGNLQLSLYTEYQIMIVGRGEASHENQRVLAALPKVYEGEVVATL